MNILVILFLEKKNYIDMPYLDNKQVNIFKKYSLERKENDGYFNIMVGHSGYNDNHYNMINKLKHFENNKVRLYFVLSYGEEEYLKKVKEFIKTNWKGEYVIISQWMDYEAYVKYFINLDAILLDGTTSYALGTILLALYFNKKIYLNDSGVLAKSFKMKNIKYYDVQSLNYIDYDELINMQEISQDLIPLCDPNTVWLDSLYQVE